MSKILNTKKGIILGIANKHSIGYSIAQSACHSGAQLCVTYQNQRLEDKVLNISEEISADIVTQCDVTVEDDLLSLKKIVKEKWGCLDFIVHSLAFADRNELQGKFYKTSKENFLNAMEISCYSLVNIVCKFQDILNEGASILTLSYLGSERAVPNYNVMGVCKSALESSVRYLAKDLGERKVRVNAISPGPVKTLAAAGIKGGSKMLSWTRENSFLKEDTNTQSVADTAVFLLSDGAKSITAQTIYIDAGYNAFGMPSTDSA